MQGGSVSQPSDIVDLWFGDGGERDAARDRCGSGTVHDWWSLIAPPVVKSVDQPAACVQERVGVFIAVACDPAGTDAVVESERLKVGLVSEIERQGHVTEPDEPQIAVDLRDDPTRETFSGGDRRAASGIADPEAA
jgi:hypothetical protein